VTVYNEIYKAWKSEKNHDNTQSLPSDFYGRAESYLKSLEQERTTGDSRALQGQLLTREIDVTGRLLRELKETRIWKIVNATRSGEKIDEVNLTDEEKALLQSVSDSLSSFKAGRPEKIKETESPETGTEIAVVRFLQDLPEIIGVNLKIYGPYKKEDVGSLPKQNAQALVRQGAAKLVEVKSPA